MNSIATMTEQKHCKDCGTDLVMGHNWTEARQRQGKYLCKACWTERDKLRMFVNGKEISKSDPLYKPGRWRTWSHVHSMEKLEREGQGYVYVIANDAWPDWVKVGCAKDADDRLSQYQTYSPFRDYRVIAKLECDKRYEKEKEMKDLFEQFADERASKGDAKYEWFKISRVTAIKLLNYQKRGEHE